MTFFVNFWLNQIQTVPARSRKWKTGHLGFNFKKHYFCRTLRDNARHKNVPPPLDLTWILKSYHARKDRSKFREFVVYPREINLVAWLAKNGKTVFSKLTQKISSFTRGEQASKQMDSSFPFSGKFFSAFWLVISAKYVVLFILGNNFLLDS